MFTPTVRLFINGDTKKIRIEDTTDLSDLDLSLVSVVGTGSITSPTGDVLATGLTINRSTGNNNSAWVDLDVDSQGDIVNGVYSFNYNYTFVGTSLPIDFIGAGNTVVYPDTDLSNVLEADDTITIASSAITGNNGVKTVTGVTYSAQTIITVVNTLTAEDPSAGVFSFNKTVVGFASGSSVFSGCAKVTPTLTVTYDCDSTQFGTITFQDVTEVPTNQTIESRVITVAYPPLLSNPTTPANQTTTEAALTIATLATGAWTSTVVYEVEVVVDSLLGYSYTATSGAQQTIVTCNGTMCSIAGCIASLNQKLQDNPNINSPYYLTAIQINGLYVQAENYRVCGDYDQMRSTIALMQTILDESDCNCGCCDETTGNVWIDNATFSGQSALDTLQDEIDTINAELANLSKNVYPLKQNANFQMSEFADLGFDEITVPATLFNEGGYLKILLTAGRSLPLTGSNIITVTNVTTGEVVTTFSIGAGALNKMEATINLYPNADTTYQTATTSVISASDLTVSLTGSVNPLDSDVFTPNTEQVLRFTASDTSLGNYVQVLEIVGYKY